MHSRNHLSSLVENRFAKFIMHRLHTKDFFLIITNNSNTVIRDKNRMAYQFSVYPIWFTLTIMYDFLRNNLARSNIINCTLIIMFEYSTIVSHLCPLRLSCIHTKYFFCGSILNCCNTFIVLSFTQNIVYLNCRPNLCTGYP